jgi:hypothetical protein
LDLAGGHAETDGELAPGGGIGLVCGLELLLEDLGLDTGGTLAMLDLVRAVVVEGRRRGFPGRLWVVMSESEWENVRVRGWERAGADGWRLEAGMDGIDERLHGGLLDRGEGREGAGGEGRG